MSDHLHRSVIRRIMIAVNRIDGIYDEISRHMGVKANTIWLLYAIDDDRPHSQKSICDEWLFHRTTLNTIIKECKDKGYITLEPIPGKSREMNICLTPSGKEYARAALDCIYSAEEQALLRSIRCMDFVDDLESFGRELEAAFDHKEKSEN